MQQVFCEQEKILLFCYLKKERQSFTLEQDTALRPATTGVRALAILRAGSEGALGWVIDGVTRADGTPLNAAYFWATGILSSFLDNAPTYLVFFNTAGGNPEVLMGELSQTLLAISAGAVFMGAVTGRNHDPRRTMYDNLYM